MFKSCPNFAKTNALMTRWSWRIGYLALLISTLGCNSKAALAEGSRELTASGGYRPYLGYRNDLYAKIPRRTTIRVYAKPGETINLGSSAVGVGKNGKVGIINYRRPDGTNGTCERAGKINNRTEEVNGTFSPCVVPVTAGQEGVWEINFVSPDPDSIKDPTPVLANADWTQPDDLGFVTAWDVTVKDSLNRAIPGRAYTNYFFFNLGSNGLQISSEPYIQTRDGYLYQIDFNNLDPFGFLFFANNKGFKDTSGNPLYRSVQLIGDNPGDVPAGITIQDPSSPDTPTDVTHKIFFNRPNNDLPIVDVPIAGGTTWLRRPPTPPPTVSNFRFTGIEGTPNQTGTAPPLGGNFTFNASASSGYRIALDINRDGIYGNANDRILFGSAQSGAGGNTVFWDGLDGEGKPAPAGTLSYGATVTLTGTGEVHFPFYDPENNNPNGLIIQQLDPNTGQPLPSIVYYNDAGLTGGTQPNPLNALYGLDGSKGVHAFTNGFGDRRGIDTWIYVPSLESAIAGGILVANADLKIEKNTATEQVVAGNEIVYTLTVTNNGPSKAMGATVQDNIPPEITGVTWTCAITSGTGSCAQSSGEGNAIDTTVDLDYKDPTVPPSVATFILKGTISPTFPGGLLKNTATVTRGKDANDPDLTNNIATREVTVNAKSALVSPTGLKSVRLAEDADNSKTVTTGDTVEYTITYANNASTPVNKFLVTDSIDPNQLNLVPGSYSFTASGIGTTVTGNPSYNGTTDKNLTNPASLGSLGAGGGNIVIKFRAVVTAPSGTQISNQASATSEGGTVDVSVTDAVANKDDMPQVGDDKTDAGNDPNNTGDDDPTVMPVGETPPPGIPSLRLVKRITSITRGGVPISGVNFGRFVDVVGDDNDTVPGWSQFSPVGIADLAPEIALRSDDQVEYTIYFLSDGTAIANDVRFCDLIPEKTTFISNSFGENSGILLNRAGVGRNLSNTGDNDEATFFAPLAPLPNGNSCSKPNNSNGAAIVNLGNVSNTAGSNYGFIRFRVKID
jgi:uncharacterized repeat protein (TIGR01451 family)/fimbrial isopeptide formation D2 family protein